MPLVTGLAVLRGSQRGDRAARRAEVAQRRAGRAPTATARSAASSCELQPAGVVVVGVGHQRRPGAARSCRWTPRPRCAWRERRTCAGRSCVVAVLAAPGRPARGPACGGGRRARTPRRHTATPASPSGREVDLHAADGAVAGSRRSASTTPAGWWSPPAAEYAVAAGDVVHVRRPRRLRRRGAGARSAATRHDAR